MILDDGGDATILLHLRTKAESDISVLDKPGSEEERVLFASIKAQLARDPKWYSTRLAQFTCVTEETTTGLHRPYPMSTKGQLETGRAALPVCRSQYVSICAATVSLKKKTHNS